MSNSRGLFTTLLSMGQGSHPSSLATQRLSSDKATMESSKLSPLSTKRMTWSRPNAILSSFNRPEVTSLEMQLELKLSLKRWRVASPRRFSPQCLLEKPRFPQICSASWLPSLLDRRCITRRLSIIEPALHLSMPASMTMAVAPVASYLLWS